jgi:hypothetical protein
MEVLGAPQVGMLDDGGGFGSTYLIAAGARRRDLIETSRFRQLRFLPQKHGVSSRPCHTMRLAGPQGARQVRRASPYVRARDWQARGFRVGVDLAL